MVDGIRIHTGLIAQEIKKAFEGEGLDPFKYGVLCFDEWDGEDEVIDESTGVIVRYKKEAGNRYGVRCEEAQAIESAMIRRKIFSKS